MRWAMLVKLFLWVGLAFCGSIWLPAAPTEMDLLDPVHFPDGDDPRSVGHRQTLLKYLLVRMALWVLFAFIFGGFPDGDIEALTPPDESILFLLWCSSRKAPLRWASFFPAVVVPGEFFQLEILVKDWPWGSAVLVGGGLFLLTRPAGHSFVVFRWGPLVLYLVVLALTDNFEFFRLVLLVVSYGYVFVGAHLREYLLRQSGQASPPRSGAFDFVWYPLWMTGVFFLISRFEATQFTGSPMDDFVILSNCALLAYAFHYLFPYALMGWVWLCHWWRVILGGSALAPVLVQPFPPVTPKLVHTLEFVERHRVPIGMGGTAVLATGGAGAWYVNRRDRLSKEAFDRGLAVRRAEIDVINANTAAVNAEVDLFNAKTKRQALNLEQNKYHFEVHQHNQKTNIWRRSFPEAFVPPSSKDPPTDGTAYSPFELEYEWAWVLLLLSGWILLVVVVCLCVWLWLSR